MTRSPIELQALFSGMDLAVPAAAITDISTSSRCAARGGLFLAQAGLHRHGLEFLDDALSAGIRAVAWEPCTGVSEPVLPPGVVGLRVPGLRDRIGVVADRFFANPSAVLDVTGITGTNGKSTVAWLVAQALNTMRQPAAYMGTLGYGIGADIAPSALTTPGCVTVHRRLREMADAGAEHVVMEVSSHALDQQRVGGVRFRTTALTNISRDHLDYHGSIEQYAATKARMFDVAGLGTAVINVGDRHGAQIANRLASRTTGRSAELITVALVDTDVRTDARLRGHLSGARDAGIGLRFAGDFGAAVLESSLWGRFNAENLVVATGVLLALGNELDAAVNALAECVAPPGRMELIRGLASGPTVVVDYAHTPDALGQALDAVRDHTSGDVWCVFGCGGDRDRGKRESMGAIASRLANYSVVTDDNPRDENPITIIEQIVAGAEEPEALKIIRDRRSAIEYAIGAARPNDTVLIAGKGHEAVQLIGGEARDFSDADTARAALGPVA